jgi:hypothetical protein
MTKAKSSKLDLGLIFWAFIAFLFIWMGVGQIKVNYVNRVDSYTSWIIPFGLIVFGGMILGVAVNKFTMSVLKGKNGKSSS